MTKCHGRARDPHERALSHLEISEITRTTLKATFATIHRAAPCDQIQTLTSQLAHISFTRGLAPIRRFNKNLNRPLHPEVLDEAMDQASRRISREATGEVQINVGIAARLMCEESLD